MNTNSPDDKTGSGSTQEGVCYYIAQVPEEMSLKEDKQCDGHVTFM